MKVVNQKDGKIILRSVVFELPKLNKWPLWLFSERLCRSSHEAKNCLNEANKLNKQSAWKLPQIKYTEILRASYCSLLKSKIPEYREPNERNAQGSSITINFHSS